MPKKLALAILISVCALAQTPTLSPKQFLLRIEPARKDLTPQNMTDDERKIAMEHFAYLKSLQAAGKLAIAAQVLDPKGIWGVIIVNAADLDAASAILNGDPMVKAGLFRGEAIPTRVVLANCAELPDKE